MDQNKSRRFVDSYSFLKGNVGVLMAARTIWSFCRLGVDSFFSLYVVALGGSASALGLMSMLGSVAQFLTRPIGGYLADSADRRKIIAFFTVALSLAYLTYAFAPNITGLLIGSFIVNLCFIQSPSLQSLVADSLSDKQMAVGFSTQMAIERVTPFLLAFVGGMLIDSIGVLSGVRIGYAGSVIGGLLVAYIRYRFLKETRDTPKTTFSLRSIPDLIVKAYRELFSIVGQMSRDLKVITLIAVLGSTAGLLTGPFWAIYATEVIGLTPSQLGFIIMVSGVLGVGTSLVSGHLVDKVGRKRTMVVSFFLIAVMTLAFVYCQTFQHVLAFWILTSVLIAFLTPAFQALFMSMVPRDRRGRTLAAVGLNLFNFLRYNPGMMAGFGFIAYIPAMAVALSSGFIYELNPRYPWFLLSTALVVIGVLTLLFIREPTKSET